MRTSEYYLCYSVVVAYSPSSIRCEIIWDKPMNASEKYMLSTYIIGVYLAVADSRLLLSLSGGDAERFVSCDSTAHTLAEE